MPFVESEGLVESAEGLEDERLVGEPPLELALVSGVAGSATHAFTNFESFRGPTDPPGEH